MPGGIGGIESSGHSASMSFFRQSLSARRARSEQFDPRLRALECFDGQIRPLPRAQQARMDRLEQSSSVNALHQSLEQRSRPSGSSLQLQRDEVQIQSNFSRVAVGGGSSAENITESLSDQRDAIGQVFGIAEALAGFNGDLSGDFLERIEQGLGTLAEALGPDGEGFQATRLDLSISFRSDSVELSSRDGRTQLSRSSEQVEIRVRFLSLNAEAEAVEPVEEVRAGLGSEKATLQGLGELAEFDFNGDGAFDFYELEELAEGLFDF